MSSDLAAASPPSAHLDNTFFARELVLEQNGSGFSRQLSSYWAFGDNRVFGGYTTSLALSAAVAATGLPALLSCYVQFLNATRPGNAQIDIEVLSRGRTTAAIRAIIKQDGVATLSVQAWLGAELPASERGDHGEKLQPESSPSLFFRMEQYPFMRIFDERTISYPDSIVNFQKSGPPIIDLWVRAREQSGDGSLISQLFDVMTLDAHLVDPVRRALDSNAIQAASMDLGIIWHSTLPFPAWRRINAEAVTTSHGFAATSAKLSDESGKLCAYATQQVRVWHPPVKTAADASAKK